MNNTNYLATPSEEDFMHNFMYDLSHMMDDQDISPEKRLEQYSDSKHLKELRKESIELGRAMISRATNATAQTNYIDADNDKELGTCATLAVCSMDPTDAANAAYEAFVAVIQEEDRKKKRSSKQIHQTEQPNLPQLTENVDKVESLAIGRSQSPPTKKYHEDNYHDLSYQKQQCVDLSEQIAKVAI